MKTLQLKLEELLSKKSILEDELIKVSEEISDMYLLIQEHGSDYMVLEETELKVQEQSILDIDIKYLKKQRKEEIRILEQQAKLQLKEFKTQQKLALKELKPKKITKREILEAEFREKTRIEKELMQEKSNVSSANIPTIIYEDLNNFLTELKTSDEQMHYVAEQCSGLLPKKKTFESLAIELGRTRERNRQIYDKFFRKFADFSRVSIDILQKNIYNFVLNLEDLEKIFAEVRTMFNDTTNFYLFLEKLSHLDKILSPFIVKFDTPRGYYNNRIFDDYCINHKLPISIEEAKKIIVENHKCDEISAAFICFNLIDKNFVKLSDGGIIPLTPSIPAMIAQAALYFENGATHDEIRIKANEIFNDAFKIENRDSEILQAASHDYIYFYEYGGARHLSFFKKEYNDEKIDDILNKSYDFIAQTSEQSCKIKEIVNSCFDNSINYYDLRFIINKLGQKNPNKPIYFTGKSNQDLAYLNK